MREKKSARVLLLIVVKNALETCLFNKSKTMLVLLCFLSSVNLFKDTTYMVKEAELED